MFKNKQTNFKKLIVFSFLFLFLITLGITITLQKRAKSQDDFNICAAEAYSCTIQPEEVIIIEVPVGWINPDAPTIQNWKVKNTGNLPAFFVPKKTPEEYLSFLTNFPGIQLIDVGDPEPDDGVFITYPIIIDQDAPASVTFNTPTYGSSEDLCWSQVETASDYSIQIKRNEVDWVDYQTILSPIAFDDICLSVPSSEFDNMGTRQFRVRADEVVNIYHNSEWSYSSTRTVAKANQSTPTIGGCSSTVNGTNCSVSASGGNGTGAYQYNYVSGPCTINTSTGLVTPNDVGNCVVRVRRLGDSNYNDSSYSSNRTIVISGRSCTIPWGGTTAHESSATGYISPVDCGSCPSRSRTCNDGTWSGAWGSYTSGSCSSGSCSEMEICENGSCVTDHCFGIGGEIIMEYNGTTNQIGVPDGMWTAGTVSRNGNCWLDRNLGATRVPTSSTDSQGYGDLFQWGRLDDGHQKRSSGITYDLSIGDVPGHDRYIRNSSNPHDWRWVAENILWDGAAGINNPCPPGWRLPTADELDAELSSWSSSNINGAYASTLKWSLGGRATYFSTKLDHVGEIGYVWSEGRSGWMGRWGRNLIIRNTISGMTVGPRGMGYSVRCLRDFGYHG